MDPIAAIFALSATCLILVLVAWTSKEDAWYLKAICLSFTVILLLLMPKYLDDKREDCSIVVNQTMNTVNVGNAITNQTHTYMNRCFTDPENTTDTFYRVLIWFAWIYFAIMLVAMLKFGLDKWREI